jgi:hypothetical protein
VSFGFSVERELVEGRYVTYDLEVCADITPPGGDGWNEPRYNAYAECCARVDSLVILRAETDAEVKICSGFIGPMEPGVVGPGRYLELAKSELEHASDTALERAEDYPDPDEAYDSARGEF